MRPQTQDPALGTWVLNVKDYPLKGVPIADVVSLRRIDARTSERIDKRSGRAVQTFARAVSADGRT